MHGDTYCFHQIKDVWCSEGVRLRTLHAVQLTKTLILWSLHGFLWSEDWSQFGFFTPGRHVCSSSFRILAFTRLKFGNRSFFLSPLSIPSFFFGIVIVNSLYTKKAVKCADPRDRKVKRLLRKLLQRQRTKAHRTMWLQPYDNLPVMTEVRDLLQYEGKGDNTEWLSGLKWELFCRQWNYNKRQECF